jgi:thiol-disulfide isomerase/thioredoxin
VPPPTKSSTAATRAAEIERQQAVAAARRRTLGSILAVFAVIAAVVLSKVIVGHGGPRSATPGALASATVTAATTGVPASVLESIGAGTAESGPVELSGQDLSATSGKAPVLYVGAEWCPFCAAERWPMVVALSRFGTFSGLHTSESSPSDSYPRTPTFSFHGATYTSDFIDFTAKEVYSNQVVDGKYALLDPLTPQEKSLFGKCGGGFPYLNLGGKFRVGVQYDPGVLKKKSMEQIAAALADPSSAVAKAIDGSANLLTAGLCRLTNDQPTTVCTTPTITELKSRVGAHG